MGSDGEFGRSTILDVAEAAEEFVEKMTDTETPASEQQEGSSKLTMEERKAKLERLRKKMVTISSTLHIAASDTNHSIPHPWPTEHP